MEIIPAEKDIFWFNVLLDKSDGGSIKNIRDTKDYFSKEDTSFIYMQLEKMDTITLKQELLNENIIVTPKDIIDKNLELNSTKKISSLNDLYGFCYINKPIFSSDLSTCIVTYGFYCGQLCARERTTVFKRENGTWKKFKIISEWVS